MFPRNARSYRGLSSRRHLPSPLAPIQPLRELAEARLYERAVGLLADKEKAPASIGAFPYAGYYGAPHAHCFGVGWDVGCALMKLDAVAQGSGRPSRN
jgi:hypothetical protein